MPLPVLLTIPSYLLLPAPLSAMCHPAVVVGFDRTINYYKIQYAQLCINENPDCEFIATNLDAVTHLTDAQVNIHSMVCIRAGLTMTQNKPRDRVAK